MAISHAISTYGDLNLLIVHLAEGTSRTFEAKGCSILLLDETENQLFHVSSFGISEEYLKKGPIIIDDRVSSFMTGEPVLIEGLPNDCRILYPEAASKEGIASMLSVPIKHIQSPVGLMRIYHGRSNAFNNDDIHALSVLCEHLGLAIENHGLKNFLEKIKHSIDSLPPRVLKGM